MDIKSVTKDYVECASGGTVTAPFNGSWISAYAIALGATEIENGSWLQTLCEQLGITQPVNSSWVIALADYYGITQPVNGSWWYAIADEACNGTPAFTGILDLYPGAEVAFSAARRLSGSYTGPLVKVYKPGATATDIGYDAGTNELDTTALQSYAGSDTVYVEKWYDQTGNGHHGEQIDNARQPIIVTNGVIEDINNKVAIRWDGQNDFMPLVSNVQSSTAGLTHLTFNRVSGFGQVALGDEQENLYPLYPFSNNKMYTNYGSGGSGVDITPDTGLQGYTARFFVNAGSFVQMWANTTLKPTVGNGAGDPTKQFDAYGTRQLSQFTNNLHSEFLFWNTQQTEAFSQGVHNNAGTFYNTGTYT